jgi:hypothetical protein
MKNIIYNLVILGILAFSTGACSSSILEEKPLSFLSPDNAYLDKAGFESGIIGLHVIARNEFGQVLTSGYNMRFEMSMGTDVAFVGENNRNTPERFWDYSVITNSYSGSNAYWNWGYQLITNANTIINRAQNPSIKWTDAEKNAYIAEARFFRAHAYNVLVNIFGGVPIVTEEVTSPKLDFTRNTRLDVLKLAAQDLEYAAQWLPQAEKVDGRITLGAANHLLSEVYISLGMETKDASYYDKSIAAASKVISDPRYQLMTTRFGANKALPGNVMSDLFWSENINRSKGNLETIWAVQFEYATNGGIVSGNDAHWNRGWGCRYWDFKDPDGINGMVLSDSIGRGVAWVRPTNYIYYDLWTYDKNDMRNSRYNIKRDWYYNNPASKYYLQKVIWKSGRTYLDTTWYIGPELLKIKGNFKNEINRTYGDICVMRLAETYLLRAEAYMWKGDKQNAANDINAVRARSQAKLVTPAEVNVDFLLDERARELVVEEPRRRTLIRLGKMVERTVKYNPICSPNVKPYNELWPIPQTAIDANVGAVLTQNPGY